MDAFEEFLRKSVSSSLNYLPPEKIAEVVRALLDAGAVEMKDLALIREEELKDVLKPIQIRRLLMHWTSFETAAKVKPVLEDPCTSTTADELTSPSAITPISINSNWPQNFKIPWEKMPLPLMHSLNNGERPHPTLRRAAVRIIADEIREVCRTPGRKALSVVVKAMVDKYPRSLSDGLCGEIVGTGHNSLLRQVNSRIENLNRGSLLNKEKRVLVESVDDVEKKRKKGYIFEKYGCYNWQPSIPACETEDTQKEKREEMKYLHKLGPKAFDSQLVKKLLHETFFSQRRDINSGLHTGKLAEEWPFLFSKYGLLSHFQELVGIDLEKKFYSSLKSKGDKIIQCLKTIPPNSKKNSLKAALIEIRSNQQSLIEDAATVLLLVLGYFGEDREAIFKTVDSTATCLDVEKLPSLPSTPCLIVCGDNIFSCKMYMLCIDGKVVNDYIDNFLEGLLLLFSSYYCCNIQYPQSAGLTLEFIQRCFCAINPDRGSKIKKAGRRNTISPKVLALINAISDFESLITDSTYVTLQKKMNPMKGKKQVPSTSLEQDSNNAIDEDGNKSIESMKTEIELTDDKVDTYKRQWTMSSYENSPANDMMSSSEAFLATIEALEKRTCNLEEELKKLSSAIS